MLSVHVHVRRDQLRVWLDDYISVVELLFCNNHLTQVTVSGILRGSGRQLLGAVVSFFCFYIVGLPLAISLALANHMGTLGFWIGLGVASTLQVCEVEYFT